MARNPSDFNNITADADVSIGTAAALVLNRRAGRRVLRIKNTHATQIIYVGPTDSVSATVASWVVPAGITIDIDGYCGAIYMIASGSATTALCMEGW